MENAKNVQKNKSFCHDCQKEIVIEDKEIKNGLLLEYKNPDGGADKLMVFKCNDCYKQNQSLTNFRSCEVYSRVVGYLRPVQQWNVGKQEEYKERKEFKCSGSTSCN